MAEYFVEYAARIENVLICIWGEIMTRARQSPFYEHADERRIVIYRKQSKQVS